MAYFWDVNEKCEFKRLNGRLYLYVIHTDHPHNGYKPHVHILDLSDLKIGEAEVERDMNKYCGMAKKICSRRTLLGKTLQLYHQRKAPTRALFLWT